VQEGRSTTERLFCVETDRSWPYKPLSGQERVPGRATCGMTGWCGGLCRVVLVLQLAGRQVASAVLVNPRSGAHLRVLLINRLARIVKLEDVDSDREAASGRGQRVIAAGSARAVDQYFGWMATSPAARLFSKTSALTDGQDLLPVVFRRSCPEGIEQPDPPA
jgi:hypothetical protein